MDLAQKQEWESRAKRDGLQSVMSVRWTDEQCTEATRGMHKRISTVLDGLEIRNVLELGCGVGRNVDLFSKLGVSDYVGLDISEGMIEKAKARCGYSSAIKMRFENKDASFIDPKEDGNYAVDLAFTCTVLAHVVNECNFLFAAENMKRLAKKYILIVEEIDSHKRRSSAYTRTDVFRSISDYIEVFEPFHLVRLDRFTCVEDNLVMMLFQRSKEWR